MASRSCDTTLLLPSTKGLSSRVRGAAWTLRVHLGSTLGAVARKTRVVSRVAQAFSSAIFGQTVSGEVA